MIYATRQLINAIKKMYPVVEFFHNRYFPDGRTYFSEKVLVETKKQGRKIAPFVIPLAGGIPVASATYRAFEYDAPYIAPYDTITAVDLSKKAFGEDPNSNRSPADRENEVESEKMDDLRNSVFRRQEEMCTQLVTTGEIKMEHYASANDAAKGQNADERLLRFYDGTFGNKWTFTKSFKTMTVSERIMEFYKIAVALKKRGVKATDIVMTSDVAMLLMSDKNFMDFYDKAKVDIGAIKPEETPDGVTFNGSININGIIMSMFTYDEYYEDLDGTVKELLPAGTIAFLQPAMGETVYAQVTFIEDKGFQSYAEKVVPRVVADDANNIMKVQTFSRPVVYPFDWDGWMVANINDEIASDDSEDEADNSSSNSTQVTYKTEEEINAMTTKAQLIEYAESIGLTTLSDSSLVADLKTAIINYQDELQNN